MLFFLRYNAYSDVQTALIRSSWNPARLIRKMVDSTSVELGLGTLETGLHLEEDRQDLLKTERLDDGSAATHTQTREMATGIPEGWTKDNENGKRTMSGGDGNEEESGEGSVPTSMDILSIPGILTKVNCWSLLHILK